jgi:outer membrane protein assembly factor BamB
MTPGWLRKLLLVAMALAMAAATPQLRAGDWPMWGGTPQRNFASEEKGLPASADLGPGKKLPGGEYDPNSARNLKWCAKLGTITCGSPVVCGGKVFIGTNNGSPRDAKYQGDYGILMCLDEASGRFLWMLPVPAVPPSPAVSVFYPNLGIASTPAVEGDTVFVVTNRGEVVCLDANGMANGNRGPFRDEAAYFARPISETLGPGVVREGGAYRIKPGEPLLEVRRARRGVPLGPADADVIWHYDMMSDLSVWPHDAAASSVLPHEDLLFVCSGNGTDNTHRNIPSPGSPTLVAINRKTGALVAVDDAQIGRRALEGSWSSPVLAKVGGRTLVVIGGPDGGCYAFEAAPAKPTAGKVGTLQKVWWFDCNPPQARFKDRAAVKYPSRAGPSEIIATPVFYKDRIYVSIGQDTRHGNAPGLLSCINANGTGDITDTGRIWQYDRIGRSLSTVSIADGLVYAADAAGAIHCLDAETGKPQWVMETGTLTCGSTLVADGKVYLGTDKGELFILAAGRELKVLAKVDLHAPIHTTPAAANGVLYVATDTHLFAFEEKLQRPEANTPIGR